MTAPNDSSSECSSSRHSSSGRLSSKSSEPADIPLDKVTNRISALRIISDSPKQNGKCIESDNNSDNQSDKHDDKRTADSERSSEAHKSDEHENFTPKSKARRIQLDKLKTPKASTNIAPPDDVEPNSPSPQSPIKILSSADQLLLNELYGTSWQTPELMKKCKLQKPLLAKDPKNVCKPKVNNTLRNKEKSIENKERRVTDEHDELSRNIQDFSMCK